KTAIDTISKRNDIALLDHDEERNILLAPTINKEPSEYLHEMRDGREITWNVTKVNADDVWAQGYYGAEVIVAVLDTGVNYNHTDLNDHLWSHPDYPLHGYDFVNNDNNPMDDHGHGTHCAGTVAGDGTSGSQTGMAPEASIMCIKLLDSSGNGSESVCWTAIEFAVDNGADVLSMSFGWQHSWGTNRTGWRNAMDYVYAADVFASVAAGNEGTQQGQYPIPDNVRTPGDCPPPWLHPDQTLQEGLSSVVCIGATDINDNLAGFSSRGPVTWESVTGYNDYAYNPGMGLIRPDISAPGANIKSLAYNSNTGYESGWSGTSMATPCVAGIIALMLSKDFTLTPAQLDQIIEENVEVAQNPKNNNFGSGRIDALASVNAIPTPNTPPNPAVNPNPSDIAESVAVNTNLSWMNGGGAASYEVFFGTDTPPTNIVNGEAVTSSSYELTETLELETVYFWSINSINDFGNADGPIWSFTTVGPADEDFESGGFTQYPWEFQGYEITWPNVNPIEDFILGNLINDVEWSIDTTEFYSGEASAKSSPITDNQASYLSLELNVTQDGMLIFWYKVASEYSPSQTYFFDGLFFIIDGETADRFQPEADGSSPWTYASYEIDAGVHTFDWVYVKDSSVSSGSDCAWLDYITFPNVAQQPPVLIINPEEFVFEALTNEIITDELTIENTGSGGGIYSIELIYTGDWLELDSYSGDVGPDEIDTILLSINPDGLENGDYAADISITDNRNVTLISVTLTIDMVDAGNGLINVNTLLGNHPNPFNPSTTISFSVAEQSNLEVSIYSIKGQKIKTLIQGYFGSGLHNTIW
ncbi:MAG: S8 family serine peptidase, partial [Candidatus Cloacimonetes bacterium]|nr:S8 family serine peptidase [Candidatus Cloacimonadota bacterium]